jgi:cysteinyl-tRNA synthetase
MEHKLHVYNSISREKEVFTPIVEGKVGLYVCGPTVYGEGHLGHARSAISFDTVFRYLKSEGYKVRYVRNITDVGHLENDADEGEDKIAKKARLDQLEPMEVAQHYTNMYHEAMDALNVLRPSIEPTASGHIIDQIEWIEKMIAKGFAYETNGSVYFDVKEYSKSHAYGELSGRNVDDLLENTRTLDGQDEKKNSADFALWKKAKPEHIMRWASPWSDGFPGWHLECTAMSTKYLGETFDIHGGGMDLLFPHHEAEIAQSKAGCGCKPANYWLHNNMITINGKKMGKSLGNFITLSEFFTGSHELLDQPYDAQTIRFFILQAHYRSTLDFSTDALKASEKGLERLQQAEANLSALQAGRKGDFDVDTFATNCSAAMNDDFNTPILIAHLFDASKVINQVTAGKASLDEDQLSALTKTFNKFYFDVLGLQKSELLSKGNDDLSSELIETLIALRTEAKELKNYALSDKIRDRLLALNVEIKDTKEGTTFQIN